MGSCLKLWECEVETPPERPNEMVEAAYGAWSWARESIYNAWMYETDPANLQPKVRKLNPELVRFRGRVGAYLLLLPDRYPSTVEESSLSTWTSTTPTRNVTSIGGYPWSSGCWRSRMSTSCFFSILPPYLLSG